MIEEKNDIDIENIFSNLSRKEKAKLFFVCLINIIWSIIKLPYLKIKYWWINKKC